MNYYNTFLKTTPNPTEDYRQGMQELVNQIFDNTSTYYVNVEEEIEFGSLEFKPCNVRVNTLVDAKTGQRVNDDYKKIIFKDIQYNPPLGIRYRFDDNIWIAFSTDNIKTDTSAVYLKRCNNTMNWQDKYGHIHREPCFIDYKVNETQPYRQLNLDIPTGRISVQCQLNKWTEHIGINNRFIFNGNAYKIRELHKFDKTITFDKNSSNIISFYADFDLQAPDDNMELEVANYKKCVYNIVTQDEIVGRVGDFGKISYTTTLNDKVVEEPVIFNSSDTNIINIDSNGNYKILKNGECTITITMTNDTSIFKNITVISKEEIIDEYINKIEPDNRRIKLNTTQKYSVYEYRNGIRQDTTFDIICSGVPCGNYRFETDGNNFNITNLRTTENKLLEVVCVNTNTKEEVSISIKLGGVF